MALLRRRSTRVVQSQLQLAERLDGDPVAPVVTMSAEKQHEWRQWKKEKLEVAYEHVPCTSSGCSNQCAYRVDFQRRPPAADIPAMPRCVVCC